mgnify:CR=1 FL=1
MNFNVCVVFFKLHPSENIKLTFGVRDRGEQISLPSVKLRDTLPSEAVDAICDTFIDADYEWLNKTEASFFENERETFLVYRVNVPHNIKLVSGLRWCGYDEVINSRDKFSEDDIKSLTVCTGI